MSNPWSLVAGLLLLLPATTQAQDISALAWLAGCWAAEGGEAGSGEQWMAPAGGTMLGIGRTVRNGKTVGHEFLQIRRNADGRMVYIAAPSGQAETSFVMTGAGEDSATFENAQHDFPQRIAYRLLPDDRLAVRIEGERDGARRGIDFPMRRVECQALSGK